MIEITKVVNPPSLGKMYRYQDTVYSTGDDEYGFHTRAAVNVYTFDIVKETPKGQWIQDEFHGIKPRFVLNSGRKRYAHKTKEQKEKRNAFINSNDELYQKEYYNKNKNAIIKYQINYKRKHPARRCINKMKIQTRHNEETLQFATRQRQLWSSDEAQFIEENAEVMTAREIAISIGRSYLATLTYASKNKIRLQTENKLHNKLITK
jgi:hypothetical protein